MMNSDIAVHMSDLRAAVGRVLLRHSSDRRAMALQQALLSQIKTVEIHLTLMTLESNETFFLSLNEFNEIMKPYLSLNKEIRRTVTREPNSLYETQPINGVYELLSHHFREDGES